MNSVPLHSLTQSRRRWPQATIPWTVFLDSISIERKSLSDLLGCIGQSRERFERELERLAVMPYPSIVVEATLAEVLRGNGRSELHPNAVLGSLVSFSTKFRIPLWFCDDRALAQRVTERLLIKAAKYASESESTDGQA